MLPGHHGLVMRTESQKTPDPNRDLATLAHLRAAIKTMEADGIKEFHELHIKNNGQGSYSFTLETPVTQKSHRRPSIAAQVNIKDLDGPLRKSAFIKMGKRCAQAIGMMNDGAGL